MTCIDVKVNILQEASSIDAYMIAMAGFREHILTVCCGGHGRYDYNDSVSCGDPDATACKDPSSSLYFDGVHLTETGYRYVADGWLNSINPFARASRSSRGRCKSELVDPSAA